MRKIKYKLKKMESLKEKQLLAKENDEMPFEKPQTEPEIVDKGLEDLKDLYPEESPKVILQVKKELSLTEKIQSQYNNKFKKIKQLKVEE